MTDDAEAPGRGWVLAALLVTVAFSVMLLIAPGASTETLHIGMVLLVPVLLCAVPLIFHDPWRRRVAVGCVAVLAFAVLMSLASVGLFLIPGLILLAVGTARMFA